MMFSLTIPALPIGKYGIAHSRQLCLSRLRSLSTTHYKKSQAISLKRIFDDSTLWKNINQRNYNFNKKNTGAISYKEKLLLTITNHSNNNENNVGLFKNSYLTDPKGLKEFSSISLIRAKELVNRMRTDKTTTGLRNYIVNLDQLSDTLCRVIDLCEFIRSVHPDEKFIDVAQKCHEEMFEFMNILNTDVTLYETLKSILNNKKILSMLSSEEIKVGNILLEDFEKSGICMNPEIRDKFISLSQDISLVGQDFINNTSIPHDNYVKIEVQDLKQSGIQDFILDRLKKDITGKYYKIPTYGGIPFAILKSTKNEDVREKIWTALHSCPDEQIKRVSHLIKLRAILANLMGKSSFAEYQLDGKMAKNPKNVQNFIQMLIDTIRPLAASELKFISDLKCEGNNLPPVSKTDDILNIVRPWDRDYYSAVTKENNVEEITEKEPISVYFTLGNVIEGLSNLFNNIYGIRLVPEVPKIGETWSAEVRKINVCSETDGIIGVIYCDLFERAGKTSNPAHFTVCCSRQTYEKENDESIMQIGVASDGSRYQLPIISLVCNFSKTSISSDNDICLLQLNEIETLFHEMGHAMHSMLGRTHLQNISGTRCPTDFVELPSILMEHFARDIRVLRKIGVHYLTNEQIPEKTLKYNLEEVKFLQNCETFAQAKMATLDQTLHNEAIIQNINSLDVVQIYQGLERQLKVLVDDKSNWCGRFGHLFGYGATYYSYLFDRAIASKVWEKLFAEDPFSRHGGTQFKDKVLKWGGLRDPWKCIGDVLEEPKLANGDTEAMKFIGKTQDL